MFDIDYVTKEDIKTIIQTDHKFLTNHIEY